MDQLSNLAMATGTYNALPTTIISETVVVSLISGLIITKETDKKIGQTDY